MLLSPKEKGQGLVEYALILVLVAVVIIAVVIILGPVVQNYLIRPTLTPTLAP
jgi:pilus assembly protein Flp/PilA